MPSTRLTINTTSSTLGAGLVSSLNQLAEARSRLLRLKDYADQAASGGDWAGMASAFGLVNSTDGQTVYNLLAGAVASLTAAGDIDGLIERIANQ